MNITRSVKNVIACILCFTLLSLILPVMEETASAKAAVEKTISGLGTGTITNPTVPKDGSTPWTGSYVYYGSFDKNYDYKSVNAYPVKYRVLDKDTTDFSTGETEADKAHTMLLDCDFILYAQPLDDNMKPNVPGHYLNEWAISDIAGHVPRDTTGWKHNDIPSLNDEKDGFIAKSFTKAEQAAITFSTKSEKAEGDGDGEPVSESHYDGTYGTVFTPLDNDRIFLLDATEITRESYGYLNKYEIIDESDDLENSEYPYLPISCRIKRKAVEDYEYFWWTRSKCINDNLTDRYCSVQDDGLLSNMWANQDWAEGVSPAFNLDIKRILFSSKVENTSGTDEYKLTVKNDSLKINIPDGKEAFLSENGKTAVVPYDITNDTINGSEATRISVLILKEKYTPGKTIVNSGSKNNYYYMKLDTLFGFRYSGFGTFELPDEFIGKKCGKDFFIYILAEDENGKKETDYASEPVEISFADGSGYSFSTSKNAEGSILCRTLSFTGTKENGNLETDSLTLYTDGSSEKNMIRIYPSGNIFMKKSVTNTDGKRSLFKKLIKKTLKGNISVRIKTFEIERKTKKLKLFETVILKPNEKAFIKEVTLSPIGAEIINKTTKKLNSALTDISAVAELLEKSDHVF